ncbi:MAG: nitroreductase/quinone reductase family protein [Myxococcota bacterium]
MSGRDWRSFGRFHTKLYRLLGGRFVGSLGGGRKVLLLTTTGRKSGLARTLPLIFMDHEGAYIVYASNGGQESPPAWWLNLRANPEASVQIGTRSEPVVARALSQAEYGSVWPKAAAYNSHWRGYQQSVEREIPLIALEPRP